MRVQRSRADVLPLTWEVPTAIAVCWLFTAILALPVGQGIASWASGESFVWPSDTLIESLIGLMRGDTGLGLSAQDQRALPPDALIYATATVCVLIVCVISVRMFTWWWRSVGPGAHFGIATNHQVDAVLGVANLRRRRRIIRPDLYRVRSRPHGEGGS